MLARQSDGSNRLFILGLGAHVLAIAILFANILASSSKAEEPSSEGQASPAAPEARESARTLDGLVPVSAPDAPARLALLPDDQQPR